MDFKRMQLFELADQDWFPSVLRTCMVNYLERLHELVGTADVLGERWAGEIQIHGYRHVLDCCSGNGGLATTILTALQSRGVSVDMTLTDKFPQSWTGSGDHIQYEPTPKDLNQLGEWSIPEDSLLTINSAFHHFNPTAARSILATAHQRRIPICIYEMSNNSQPKWLWWLAILPAMIGTLFLTPTLKRLSWQQLVFTYLIPILPICIAWDGAVSNARTYTRDDLTLLIEGFDKDYTWEIVEVSGQAPMPMLLCMGRPEIDGGSITK